MGLKVLKCENCGAMIERNDNNELFCPNCGYKYTEKEDVNNTYITNNQNITKVFYGNSSKIELDNEKIRGYILRIYDAMELGCYSEVRDYCNSILSKDPYNKIAITVKSFLINILKKENGRYRHIEIKDVFTFVFYLCDRQDINDYIEIFDLAKRLLETTDAVPDKSIIDLCNETRKRVENLNNEYTKEFLDTLTEFQNGISKMLEKIDRDNAELNLYQGILLKETKKFNDLRTGFWLLVFVLSFILIILLNSNF